APVRVRRTARATRAAGSSRRAAAGRSRRPSATQTRSSRAFRAGTGRAASVRAGHPPGTPRIAVRRAWPARDRTGPAGPLDRAAFRPEGVARTRHGGGRAVEFAPAVRVGSARGRFGFRRCLLRPASARAGVHVVRVDGVWWPDPALALVAVGFAGRTDPRD